MLLSKGPIFHARIITAIPTNKTKSINSNVLFAVGISLLDGGGAAAVAGACGGVTAACSVGF